MEVYAVGVSFWWELDFFGRIRRANEAELAQLLATQEASRAVALTLVSEVARAYVELRDLDRRLEISRRTLESRREYVALARDRFEGGVTPELDWRQAEAEFFRVQSFVFEMEKQVAQKENELSVLLGRNPGAHHARPIDGGTAGAARGAGRPAGGAARAPSGRARSGAAAGVRDRAHRGSEGDALSPDQPHRLAAVSPRASSTSCWTGTSQSWNVFAGLLQPIFNAGRNKRRVEVRESQQRQAVYEYENTLLRALREVEDSLVGLHKAGEQRGSQRERVGAEREVLELAELRYRGGVAAYLEVLDAQRSLFNAEIDETASISEHVLSLVRLYKALGGGWPVAQEEQEGTATPSGGSPSAPEAASSG